MESTLMRGFISCDTPGIVSLLESHITIGAAATAAVVYFYNHHHHYDYDHHHHHYNDYDHDYPPATGWSSCP